MDVSVLATTIPILFVLMASACTILAVIFFKQLSSGGQSAQERGHLVPVAVLFSLCHLASKLFSFSFFFLSFRASSPCVQLPDGCC